MDITKVRVDGAEFFLTTDQDVDDLKQLIVEAVRKGGDFVTMRTVGRGPISVLCTPGIPVRFELVQRSSEQLTEWETEPPSFDLAFFDDYPPETRSRTSK